ncbi:MAG: GyrI-like domain-containing protein, partial [Anaerolineae bacterium]|nr:GyrI-like domain-containing protein [Anaerolineae bacterium]
KVTEPKIDQRPEQPYIGIRTRTPMKGMFKVIDKLFKEMNAWAKAQGFEPAKPPFLRYHVIDMEGEMDIEVGFPVDAPMPGNDRVQPGVIPAGRYASLVYVGNGYTGNKTLILWARDNGIEWDAWDDPRGHAFRSRYEAYLTDPKVEPRKTKWEVEVAIKLKDE